MKTKISIPLDEQETCINHSPAMGDWCEVYTTEFFIMRQLEKLSKEYPEHYQIINDDSYSLTVRVLWKLAKPRKPRIISDTQKEALTERLKNL